MKKVYSIIFIFFLGFNLNARLINIPDANFRNALVNTNCVSLNSAYPFSGTMDGDLNNDGEISGSEAY